MRLRLPFRRRRPSAAAAAAAPALPALEAYKRELEADPDFLAWRLCEEHSVSGPGANVRLCLGVISRVARHPGRAREEHVRLLCVALGDGSEALYRID